MGGFLQIRPSLPIIRRMPVREVFRLGYYEGLSPVFTPAGKDHACLLQQSSWLVEPCMQTAAIGCFCNREPAKRARPRPEAFF